MARGVAQQVLRALRLAGLQQHGGEAAIGAAGRGTFSSQLAAQSGLQLGATRTVALASGAAARRLPLWLGSAPLALCRLPLRHGLATIAAGASARGAAASKGSSKASRLLGDLKQLSKFKLSALVVLTASAGFVMGSGEQLDWQALLYTSLGTFGAAACANTLNQVYEVANDRLMSRTCNRPLPAGRLNRAQALAFALVAGYAGLSTLYATTNEVTTALGAANILLYAGVYTPLKQLSIANTWVGAVVGAIPPLMGWSAATGGELGPGAWVLAGALFFWQLPHFLALAWLCKDDYLRGGFRMISGADATGRRTALAALRNSAYLLPLGLVACAAGVASEPFAWEAAALAGMLCVPAARFALKPSQQAARKLFRYSLLYLPLAMLGMVVHRLPQQHQAGATTAAAVGALSVAEEEEEEEQQRRGHQAPVTWGQVWDAADVRWQEAKLLLSLSPATPLAARAGAEGDEGEEGASGARGGVVPQAGAVSLLMRASLDRTVEAFVRVLGLGRWLLTDLRCPSTVHSDDGRRRAAPASGDGEAAEGRDDGAGEFAPAAAAAVVVVVPGGAGLSGGRSAERRRVDWQVAEQAPPGAWREGLEIEASSSRGGAQQQQGP